MFPDHIELEPKRNWRGNTRIKPPFYRRVWFSVLMALTIVGAVAAFVGYNIVMVPLQEKAESFDLNELRKLEAASIIYDRNGEELFRDYMLNRRPVPFREIPQHLVDALVAQEDSRFFGHDGVDYQGIARALWLNYQAGRETQGASTITQQLARNTFDLKERSYMRKILEVYVARRVEQNFSKPQILELYLNRIYFGGGFYGIQAACQGYFGKDVKDINVQEAATLCGLIKSPNNIQPLRHPERALKERNSVLDRMVIEGYLGPEKAAELKRSPLITTPQEGDARLSYLFDEVRRVLVEHVGEDRAATGGFQIYTSIDKNLQRAAEESVRRRLAEVEQRPGYNHQTYAQFKALMADYRDKRRRGVISPEEPKPVAEYLQGATMAVENDTGAVLALVGGRDFIDSQFNRALNTRRPAGTAFIPFVYAAAFSHGDLFPGTLVEDTYVSNRLVMIGALDGVLGEWGTEDPTPSYAMASISAREALVKGRNSATVNLAIRLGEALNQASGVRAGAEQEILMAAREANRIARASGIQSSMKEYQSAILGTNEVELDEFCLAYTAFPNGGTRPARLHLVERIAAADDTVIFQVETDKIARAVAIDPIAAYQTHSCLVEALQKGTGAAARAEFGLEDFPAAGKTGTHDEFKDLWFMGYTSAVTCGVWVGFDRQKTIYEGAFSSRIALPIWTDIINQAAELFPPVEISPPPGAERVELCKKSGMKATDFCFDRITQADGSEQSVRSTYYEYVRPGIRFDFYCTEHTSEGVTMDILAFSRGGIEGRLISGTSAVPGRFNHITPVRMQGLTILGQDPYKSVQPVRRAQVVLEDGQEARRAEVVETVEDEEGEELPIRLSPPPRIFIDADESKQARVGSP